MRLPSLSFVSRAPLFCLAALLPLTACEWGQGGVASRPPSPRVFHQGVLRPYFSLHPLEAEAPALGALYSYALSERNIQSGKDAFPLYESSWTIFSDRIKVGDEEEVTGTVRDDIFFHNGKRMTPDDVAFTFRHARETRLSISPRPLATVEIGEGGALHFMKKVDQPWVRVAQLPILNRTHEEESAYKTGGPYVPMGTGPYRFLSYDEKNGVVRLERFDGYFVKAEPFYDLIEIRLYDSERDLAIAFLTGKIDYSYSLTATDLQMVAKDPGVAVAFFNHDCPFEFHALPDGATKDRRVRKALSLLIDREKLASSPSIAPFAYKTSDAPFRLPLSDWPESYAPVGGDEPMYDPARAYRLLEEAGWRRREGRLVNRKGEGLDVVALVAENTSESQQNAVQQVIGQWADAGILLEKYRTAPLFGVRPMAPLGGDATAHVFFRWGCLQETLGEARRVYCGDEQPPELSACRVPAVAALVDEIERQPDHAETLQPRFARLLRDQALVNYLYFSRVPVAMRNDIPEKARGAIMRDPYYLGFLYQGDTEAP